MATYALWQGTRTGVRIVIEATGETATASGRVLDNMSQVAAEEAMRLLERRDALREQRLAGIRSRNDLAEIIDTDRKAE